MEVRELIKILEQTRQDAQIQLVYDFNKIKIRAKFVEYGAGYNREFIEDLVEFKFVGEITAYSEVIEADIIKEDK